MAVSQADIDSLNAAIATGARSVSIGGTNVIYNTTESLIKARDDMRKELLAQNAQPRSRQNYAVYAGRDYE